MNARRGFPLTKEQMIGRICTCPENPNVDEWGDNSWLPCMSMDSNSNISCKECIYCEFPHKK